MATPRFRCSDEEEAELKAAAKREGLSFSAWARRYLLALARGQRVQGAPIITDQRGAEPRAPRVAEVTLPPGVVTADELPQTKQLEIRARYSLESEGPAHVPPEPEPAPRPQPGRPLVEVLADDEPSSLELGYEPTHDHDPSAWG